MDNVSHARTGGRRRTRRLGWLLHVIRRRIRVFLGRAPIPLGRSFGRRNLSKCRLARAYSRRRRLHRLLPHGRWSGLVNVGYLISWCRRSSVASILLPLAVVGQARCRGESIGLNRTSGVWTVRRLGSVTSNAVEVIPLGLSPILLAWLGMWCSCHDTRCCTWSRLEYSHSSRLLRVTLNKCSHIRSSKLRVRDRPQATIVVILVCCSSCVGNARTRIEMGQKR